MSSKSIKVNKFWSQLQNFIGSSVPEIIVKSCICAGYDSAISLSNLDEDDIAIIQNSASVKLKDLISKCSLYSEAFAENGQFVFLPGHKKTILNLRVKAEQFVENKKQKTINSEEVELFTEEEVEKLKETLLKKLNTSNVNTKFGEEAILGTIDPYISHNSRQSRRKASYRCTIQCMHCDKKIPATFNGHWEVSNIDRHIKSHIKKNPELASTPLSLEQLTNSNELLSQKCTNQTKKSSKSSNNLQIDLNNSISDEIDKVLGLNSK